jgi:hypothetical protein
MILKINSDIFFVNSFDGLGFVMETQCVFCMLGTEFYLLSRWPLRIRKLIEAVELFFRRHFLQLASSGLVSCRLWETSSATVAPAVACLRVPALREAINS